MTDVASKEIINKKKLKFSVFNNCLDVSVYEGPMNAPWSPRPCVNTQQSAC